MIIDCANYRWLHKLSLPSQIIVDFANYRWLRKLSLAAQITIGCSNYRWLRKLSNLLYVLVAGIIWRHELQAGARVSYECHDWDEVGPSLNFISNL